ncbi:hypothetical protein THAOC_37091, partial [Thalassiosira oceanica]
MSPLLHHRTRHALAHCPAVPHRGTRRGEPGLHALQRLQHRPPSPLATLTLHHTLHPSMSSPAVDYDALEATTTIEEITEDECDQETLRSLKNDELPSLWLRETGLADQHGDYELRSSTELGWLGHFMKKSTRLESFGILGGDVFHNCSEQSIDRFLFDLRKCNHIKKMHFVRTYLAEIIYKLGGAMKSNSITHLVVEGCHLRVPEATFLFNNLPDVMEELWISCEHDGEDVLDDDIMAECIPSLANCTGMRKLKFNGLNLSTNSCAALGAVFPR